MMVPYRLLFVLVTSYVSYWVSFFFSFVIIITGAYTTKGYSMKGD